MRVQAHHATRRTARSNYSVAHFRAPASIFSGPRTAAEGLIKWSPSSEFIMAFTISLSGRTALVTGASKGVGKGVALGLAQAGCDIAVNYNSDRKGAEETAAEITGMGRRALIVGGSVGSAADVDRMFQEIDAWSDKLDILVNNAGVQTWKPLLELAEKDWDHVIDTNLKGCYLCTQRAALRMKKHKWGRIVNIGSGCNKLAFPNLVDYTASKGGIEMLTKVSAVELGPLGITVNCVAPGAIEVERTRDEAGDYAGTWAKLTPVGRVGLPSDVANAVTFLAGDASEFISGQTIWVDGALFSKPAWPY
jgi:NAD(P)-dependent dehydrogenase (short-subunit alcohol dehydrogenase family)